MIEALTTFFGSVAGIITAIVGGITALGITITALTKYFQGRTSAEIAKQKHAVEMAQEKTKFETHLLDELARTRAKAAEDLAVERAYSKTLLDKLGIADSHVVDCNERLRRLEESNSKKDEQLAVNTKIIERMDRQVQDLLEKE